MDNKIKIAVINGPNINMLGIREPDVYGVETWQMIRNKIEDMAEILNVEVVFYQSNHEGDIVDFIQENLMKVNGVVINPAAFTKTSYSILDALTVIDLPYVEVHISNIFAREQWHSETIFASRAIGHINGFGGYGYCLGLQAICNHIKNKKSKEVNEWKN